MYTDLQTCSRIAGDRLVRSSAVTELSSILLQYAAGYLWIRSHSALTRIDLPSLSAVGGYLHINGNSALTRIELPSLSSVGGLMSIIINGMLTFAHLPKLTYISGFIGFCSNHASFRIPDGPPNAPEGGLVVTGPIKGQVQCPLSKQGDGSCALTTCP